jgi:hypothetical protein
MRTLKWIGVALYAAVLVLAPFTHHDIACHLKNPQHCTACSSAQASIDPATLTSPAIAHLTDVGWAVSSYCSTENILLSAGSTGRSPPASF